MKDKFLSESEVKFLLSELEKAKDKIYALDINPTNILIHLNNIGAKLTGN